MILGRDTSIERKIAWVVMVTTVAALLLAMSTVFFFEVRQTKATLRQEIASVAEIIGANMTAALEFDDPQAGEKVLSAVRQDPRVVAAGVYDAKENLFVRFLAEDESAPLIADRLSQNAMSQTALITLSHPIYLNKQQIGTLFIRAMTRQIRDRLMEYLIILSTASLVALVAAFMLSSNLRKLIASPILQLTETARYISQTNDYSIRAEKKTNDETGILIDQFNAMLDEITKTNKAVEKSKAQLEASEHQLRLITDSLPVLIAYIDKGIHYQFTNAAYERWFGLSRQNLKGQSLEKVWGDAYVTMRPWIEKVLQGEQVTYESAFELYQKELRHLSITYIPDFDEEYKVSGFFALISDVTDRKVQEDELKILNSQLEARVQQRTEQLQLSQEKLRHSERLASIGTLAAGIAHEIRNPLNSILLATQYALKTPGDLAHNLKQAFEIIGDEAKRCSTIIKNVLLFAKSEQTEKLPHNINDVVKHAVDIAKSYSGRTFEVDVKVSEEPTFAVMNPTEIEQVIVNLMNNAVEASAEMVKINITVQSLQDKVSIAVRDDGPGIPPDVINHIFDPFFSTKRKNGNTGLGLSLSHGIVREHGGAMQVQSRIGSGTVFKIELPRASV